MLESESRIGVGAAAASTHTKSGSWRNEKTHSAFPLHKSINKAVTFWLANVFVAHTGTGGLAMYCSGHVNGVEIWNVAERILITASLTHLR